MKKIYILVAVLAIVAIGAYVFVSQRNSMHASTPAANPAPVAAANPAPAAAAKPAPAAAAKPVDKNAVQVNGATMQSSIRGSKRENITLPYVKMNGKPNERLDFVFNAVRTDQSTTLVRIIPDDCVETLEVNDMPVKLASVIDMKKRCDYAKGFVINLKNYLHTGANKLRVVVVNQGGPAGLRVFFLPVRR